MFRKTLLKILGLEDYERIKENYENISKKVEDLENNLNSLRECMENIRNSIDNRIEKIERESITKEDLEDIRKQIETLNLLINGIIKIENKGKFGEASKIDEDEDKNKILKVLYERGELNITELLNSVDMGAKKFYRVLNELKKEKKVEIVKNGRAKIVRLRLK